MKILIELPTWLGDTIMASPAIENLATHFENPEITLIGPYTSIEVLKNQQSYTFVWYCVKKILFETNCFAKLTSKSDKNMDIEVTALSSNQIPTNTNGEMQSLQRMQSISSLNGEDLFTGSTSQNNNEEVVVWGTGKAMREFLYVDDMAEASLFVLELDKETYKTNTKPMLSHINVGTGLDMTIREMAETMKKVVGFEGVLTFDTTKSDGVPRKLIDVSCLSNLGWNYTIDLEDGLRKTYKWYLAESNK